MTASDKMLSTTPFVDWAFAVASACGKGLLSSTIMETDSRSSSDETEEKLKRKKGIEFARPLELFSDPDLKGCIMF
jgi:hypothetical protein